MFVWEFSVFFSLFTGDTFWALTTFFTYSLERKAFCFAIWYFHFVKNFWGKKKRPPYRFATHQNVPEKMNSDKSKCRKKEENDVTHFCLCRFFSVLVYVSHIIAMGKNQSSLKNHCFYHLLGEQNVKITFKCFFYSNFLYSSSFFSFPCVWLFVLKSFIVVLNIVWPFSSFVYE